MRFARCRPEVQAWQRGPQRKVKCVKSSFPSFLQWFTNNFEIVHRVFVLRSCLHFGWNDQSHASAGSVFTLNRKTIRFSIIQADSSVDITNPKTAFQFDVTRVIFQFSTELGQFLRREAYTIIFHLKQHLIPAFASGTHEDRASLTFVLDAMIESIFNQWLEDQF